MALCPLYGRCPILRVSVIRGSTVTVIYSCRLAKTRDKIKYCSINFDNKLMFKQCVDVSPAA